MMGPAKHFRDSARKLGLEEEARYFERLSDYAKADQKRRWGNKSAENNLLDKKEPYSAAQAQPWRRDL